jgi:glycosyltransferase involved in cell wall biosynthesis
MKLLYITNGINGAGGLERVLSVKASYLAEHYNYDVTILSLNETHPNSFYSFSSKVVLRSIVVTGNPIVYLKTYVKGIKKTIKEIQPDIISVCDDGLKGFFIPNLVRTNIPIIYERHASIALNTNNTIKGKIMYYLMQKQASKFDRFVVLTDSNKKEWQANNVLAISNPLSFYPKVAAKLVAKKVIVVGSHSYNKGYDLLLETWATIAVENPDWELHIYGKIDKEKTYLKLADKLKITNSVYFHEPVADVKKEYLNSSLMVLPSRSEGFGMVLIEAMACGVPCVSFDCPSGPRDIIKNNEDGFLVANGNTVELAKAINQLIGNEQLRNHMGAKAKETVKRYLPENIVAQWDQLFKELTQ